MGVTVDWATVPSCPSAPQLERRGTTRKQPLLLQLDYQSSQDSVTVRNMLNCYSAFTQA